MEPGRAAADELQAAHGNAQGDQQRHDVSLGVKGVHGGCAGRPVATCARGLGAAPADRRRAHALVRLAIALENLADFEQSGVAQALVRIALDGGDQARQQGGPHVRQLRCDGVGQRQRGRAAAKERGAGLGDEGPGHRLDEPARRQRAPGEAGALLQQGEDRLADGLLFAQQGRRDHAV